MPWLLFVFGIFSSVTHRSIFSTLTATCLSDFLRLTNSQRRTCTTMASIQHGSENASTGPTEDMEQTVPHTIQNHNDSKVSLDIDSEQQILPHNNISLVMFSLMLTTFLVRLSLESILWSSHSSCCPLSLLSGCPGPNDVCHIRAMFC